LLVCKGEFLILLPVKFLILLPVLLILLPVVEVDDTCMEEEIPWQTIQDTKRNKHRFSANPTSHAIPLVNRYYILTDPRNTDTNTGTAETTTVKSPPIFIYGVTNLPEMREN
jgi:hypothetical protein